MSQEFGELHAEAAEIDLADAPTPAVDPATPAEADPPAVDPVQEAAAVFGVVVAVASPLLPYLPKIYTPETLRTLAAAYVPVAEKYGWSMGGLLDGYAAEIALIATAAPLAMQTWQAHKSYIDGKRDEQRKAQDAGTPPPAAPAPIVEDRGGMLLPA